MSDFEFFIIVDVRIEFLAKEPEGEDSDNFIDILLFYGLTFTEEEMFEIVKRLDNIFFFIEINDESLVDFFGAEILESLLLVISDIVEDGFDKVFRDIFGDDVDFGLFEFLLALFLEEFLLFESDSIIRGEFFLFLVRSIGVVYGIIWIRFKRIVGLILERLKLGEVLLLVGLSFEIQKLLGLFEHLLRVIVRGEIGWKDES